MLSMFKKVSLGFALAAMMAPSVAKAADGHFGVLPGFVWGKASGSDSRTAFGIGAEVGYKFMPEFGVNATFLWSKKDGVTVMPFGVEGLWYSDFGLNAGLNLGMSRASGGGASATDFYAGVTVGYDYPVADMFTVGVKIPYSLVFSDTKFHSVGFLANASIWF